MTHQMPPGPEGAAPGAPFADATWDDAKAAREAEQNAGYAPGEAPVIDYEEHAGPQVIDTSTGADGLRKCVNCGAADIFFDMSRGMLACRYCRHAWAEANADAAFGLDSPISELRGRVLGSASGALVPDTDSILTLKCVGCGADVVINTDEAVQARCHWCRQKLSLGTQLPNGAVPDVVLPFSLPKEEAVRRIGEFVGARKFFAHPQFRAEFAPENVLGVYLPYMLCDVNAQVRLEGVGEHTTAKRQVDVGDNKTETRYDYDVYKISRDFALYVDDLSVESSAEKRDIDASRNTNNIINAIMPFDTKNAVRYDPNYLAGFSSQRRDVEVDALLPLAQRQALDIGRFQMLESIKSYDRGVRWDTEHIDVVGERWVSAYLPVWLYSYLEKKDNGKELLHYIAVNGRTGETMGSVPLNMKRLWIASGVAQVLGTAASIFFFWL